MAVALGSGNKSLGRLGGWRKALQVVPGRKDKLDDKLKRGKVSGTFRQNETNYFYMYYF